MVDEPRKVSRGLEDLTFSLLDGVGHILACFIAWQVAKGGDLFLGHFPSNLVEEMFSQFEVHESGASLSESVLRSDGEMEANLFGAHQLMEFSNPVIPFFFGWLLALCAVCIGLFSAGDGDGGSPAQSLETAA